MSPFGFLICALLLLPLRPTTASAEANDLVQPPEKGIAARYPGDRGIGADPDVILTEDFEADPVAVGWMEPGGWINFRLGEGMEIVGTKPAAGTRCLQFNLETGKKSSGTLMHLFDDQEEVFFRYYRRFADDWVWPDGYGPHDAFVGGGEYGGRPTDQDFEILIDFWRNGGTVARLASSRPEAFKEVQGAWTASALERDGSPSVGGRPVPWNRSEPDLIQPGAWHCVEMQIVLSSAGGADGVLRVWVNGNLVTDYAEVPMLAEGKEGAGINKVFIGPYFHPGSPRDQPHWVDQIVVAKSYIGPVTTNP